MIFDHSPPLPNISLIFDSMLRAMMVHFKKQSPAGQRFDLSSLILVNRQEMLFMTRF